MVLIKINEVPNDKIALRNRVRKSWRINPNRLYNQSEVLAVYKGEILEVYKILSYKRCEDDFSRVEFDLEEIESNLKGKIIETKTSNPCTIINTLTFK